MGLAWSPRAGVTSGVLAAMERVDAPASLHELAAAAARDTQARDVLLARIRDMALKYARVRLGRFGAEDTAQDVAQEVCMAVMTALPTYEDRGLPFEALVYTITSRKLADAQRQVMRGPSPVEEIPDGADERPTPEQAAVTRDELESALRLMSTLPVQQREIGDPADLREAPAAVDVGLQDVDASALEPLAALVHGGRELGAADPGLDALGEPAVPIEVVVLQRRFGEVDVAVLDP